ncbi:hypothetical protein [Cohnella zeiphila]|uniref:Uncharacterized protein n=1 Tax=Cohnella zeiphila TaxID=2761120 RepID=A0A7X0SP95_9BACL|nr:hypothetical protein [Cohnella zeiphila]MBB6733663.1 hypothetical protein [Cohnella zeiphila]
MDALAEWNEKLTQCRMDLQLKEKRERRLKELEAEVKRQRRAVADGEAELDRERDDVRQLRKTSLSRLWFRMVGQLDERLNKEEREAAEAELKLETARAALGALEASAAEAREALREVDGAGREFDRILEEKKAWIHLFDEPTSRLLEQLADESADRKARLREIDEAVSAGERARTRLDSVREKLGSAKNWGTYDMLGGGMISTAIKHNRIDEARSMMHEAQHSLRLFEKELRDLSWTSGAGDADIGGFLTFADYFFDGFLTDWIVQGRINEALEKTDSGRIELGRQLSRLESERRKTISERDGLDARYRETIERR